MTTTTQHCHVDVDGIDIFYREAGPANAPVLLLPHGYPCSSYEFRNYLPRLADRWRLIAPDFPGCGYSATPDDFGYTFDDQADFLARFMRRLDIARCALYLHDFGSQIGLRVAIANPSRIVALIIQNGDIYEDALGPKYAPLQEYWRDPSAERYATIAAAITREHFKEEFLNGVGPAMSGLIAPDLWELHWSLMSPRRKKIAADVIAGLRDNLAWFPRYQAYLREHRPPTLIVWGPHDGYMPEGAARAYLRDLPEAELHLLDGGHWLLETHLDEVVDLSRDFLSRHLR
jgi:pimeloyl-ACP methyl ester carboxylesterase